MCTTPFLVLLLALAPGAHAATWTVGPFGADFDNITDALDAASSGDTIEVSAGAYPESITFDGKNLTLSAVSGPEATSILADDGQPVVSFTSGEGAAAVLSGFTLQASGAPAVEIEGAEPTLEDLIFTLDDESPALLVTDGAPTVLDSTFGENKPDEGGHVYATGASALTVSGCTFEKGFAPRGSSWYLDEGVTATVSDSAFYNNYGYYSAVYVGKKASLTLEDVAFGVAGTGQCGAIMLDTGSTFSVTRGTWTDCSTWELQGTPTVTLEEVVLNYTAIQAFSVDLTVRDSTFVHDGSYVLWVIGGPSTVDIDGSSFTGDAVTSQGLTLAETDLRVSNSTFADFRGAMDGGAIKLTQSTFEGSTLAFTDNDVSHSGTTNSGGAIYALGSEVVLTDAQFVGNTSDADGGSIYVEDDDSSLSCTRCTFEQGTRPNGGNQIYLYETAEVVLDGCSFQDDSAGIQGEVETLEVHNSSFEDLGAGIEVTAIDLEVTGSTFSGSAGHGISADADTILIDDSTFTDLVSTRYGAAVQAGADTSLTVSDSTFIGNVAPWGGGALYLDGGAVTLQRHLFCGNRTYGSGGALRLWRGTLVVEGSIFLDNTAASGGGISLSSTDDAATLTNNSFLANDASTGGHVAMEASLGAVVSNTLFAWAGEGDGVWSDDDSASYAIFGYNDFWSNTEAHVGGALDEGVLTYYDNLFVDPDLPGYTGDCADDLRPDVDSPLVDAGNPDVLDPDGSPSDIGAFGGSAPYAFDGDGDGSDYQDDCDDGDDGVYPGAEEIPDDGVDQDCDGADDVTPDTGDTGETDTGDDTGSSIKNKPGDEGKCGCASDASPTPWTAMGVGVGLIVARRRRASLGADGR